MDTQTKKSTCCGGAGTAQVQSQDIKEYVKDHYAKLVKSDGISEQFENLSADAKAALSAGYSEEQLTQVPKHAAEHSFGCGNPVALADIKPGQTVLDIGSGAGIDVLLASKIVGPSGSVIGLDMTPSMIEAAQKNATDAGATNVEFRLGDAEKMPVESNSVDWIISNCVINLAPDKEKVFNEAFRVLKSGGRIMVSDIVTHGLPEEIQKNLKAWASCVAGAIEEDAYLATIRKAGFTDVAVVASMDYDECTIREFLEEAESVPKDLVDKALEPVGRVSTVKVTAKKP